MMDLASGGGNIGRDRQILPGATVGGERETVLLGKGLATGRSVYTPACSNSGSSDGSTVVACSLMKESSARSLSWMSPS